jgi:hypothetical protein
MLPQLLLLPSSARHSLTQSGYNPSGMRRNSIKQYNLTPIRSPSIEERLEEDHRKISSVIHQYMEVQNSGVRIIDSNIDQLQTTNSLLDVQIKHFKELTKSQPKSSKKIYDLKEKHSITLSFIKGSSKHYGIASKLKYSPFKFSIRIIRCNICRRKLFSIYFPKG